MKKRLITLLFISVILLMPLFSAPTKEYIAPALPYPTYNNYNYSYSENGTLANTVNETSEPTLTEILYSLTNLYGFVDKNGLYDIDKSELEYLLIEALLKSTGDQYTYFIRPDQADDFQESSSGVYGGIGITFTKLDPSYIDENDPKTYMAIISDVFSGSPADRAGIKPNDMIKSINGEDVAPLLNTEVSKILRGEIGKPVTVTIMRGDEEIDFNLTPELIETPSAEWELINGNIGYIMISEFTNSTSDNVLNAINELKSQGADRYILDLRGNYGGLVTQATQLANMFLERGTILTTKYKEGSNRNDTLFTATAYHVIDESVPIVILADGTSASSSEIFIAALKDNGRAIVVGEKTFGKGIVQEVIPFLDGYLNITTASYLTPSGKDIHNNGIEPDYEVKMPDFNTDEIREAYIEFMKDDKLNPYLEEHPEYTKENIKAFAELYKDSGLPELFLELLIENQYYFSLPYGERPLTDPEFDIQLKRAIEIINSMK